MIQHGKEILTNSYFDGNLANSTKELEISVISNKNDLLKDIIEALSVITNNSTTKLSLTIMIDNKQRVRLIKKWRV